MRCNEIASIILIGAALFWIGKDLISEPTVTITQPLADGTTVSCSVPASKVTDNTTCIGGSV